MGSTTGFWRGRRFAMASTSVVAALAMCVPSAGAAIKTASTTSTIAAGTARNVFVDCPEGTVAVSAGFRVGGFSTVDGGVAPTASRITYTSRTPGSNAFGVNASDSDGTLTDYAYCDTEPRDIVTRIASTRLSPGLYGTVTANCPRGTHVIGGGFVATYGNDSLVTTESRRLLNGWSVEVYNRAPHASYIKSLATCQDHAPKLEMGFARATTDPAQHYGVATVEPSCPPATRPVSGGFNGQRAASSADGTAAPLTSRRLAGGWRLTASAISPEVDATLTGFVYCEPL
jgi:hypothetical protein